MTRKELKQLAGSMRNLFAVLRCITSLGLTAYEVVNTGSLHQNGETVEVAGEFYQVVWNERCRAARSRRRPYDDSLILVKTAELAG